MKLKFKRSLLFAFSCAILFASPLANLAYSQDNEEYFLADASTEITSSAVQITATRSEKALLDVPMSVSVITEEEIRKMGATSVSDVLSAIPGIYVEESGVAYDLVSIRGEVSSRTLILVDGQKISSISEGHNRGASFVLDPSIIERIEVIKGAASVLYGAEAMGGVINIITKKGFGKPINGEITTTYSTKNKGVSTNASLYGSSNNFNYRAGVFYNNLNDYTGVTGSVEPTDTSGAGANAFISYDFTDDTTAGFSFDYFSKDTNFAWSNNYENEKPSVYSATNWYYTRAKAAPFIEIKNITDNFTHLRFDAYYQDNNRESRSLNSADNWSKTDNGYDSLTRNLGFSTQADFVFGDNIYAIAGYEFLRETLDYDGTGTSTGRIREGYQDTHAAYLSLDYNIMDDLVLNLGSRYTAQNMNLDNYINGSITVHSQSSSVSKPVFNASLVYSGFEDFALRALWSQGFRPATLYEKYFTFSASQAPNPELKAETSDNFEIGLRYATSKAYVDVALFYTITDNLHANDYNNVPLGYAYIKRNAGSAYKYGAEVEASMDFESGFSPYFSATLLRQRIDDSTSASWYNGLPTFQGRAGVKYHKEFDNYYTFNANLYVEGQTEINSEDKNPLSSYLTTNLSLGLEWGKEHQFFTQLNLLNITNEEYKIQGDYSNIFFQLGFNAEFVVGYNF